MALKSAGIVEGVTKGKREVAKNMMAMGLDIATIIKATGLSEEEIRSIEL